MKTFISILFFAFAIILAHAQIPVEKDSFHKTIFENEKVRILDLSVSGTDTTATHLHKSASVVVFISKSKLAIQTPGDSPVITNVEIGNTIYRAYDKKPVIHRVWSEDGSLMRCIVIEIKE